MFLHPRLLPDFLSTMLILVAHLIVILVAAISIICVIKGIALLWSAHLKGIVLPDVKAGKLVKVVDWSDLEFCSHIGDERSILHRRVMNLNCLT